MTQPTEILKAVREEAAMVSARKHGEVKPCKVCRSIAEEILSIRLNEKLEPDPEGRYGVAVVDREAEIQEPFMDELEYNKQTCSDFRWGANVQRREIRKAGFVQEVRE